MAVDEQNIGLVVLRRGASGVHCGPGDQLHVFGME